MRLGRLPQNSFDRLAEKALPVASVGKRMKRVGDISILPGGVCELTVSMLISTYKDIDICFDRAYNAMAAVAVPNALILTVNARRRDSEKQIRDLLCHYNDRCMEKNISLYPSCIQVLGDQRVYTLTMLGKLRERDYAPMPGAYVCMAGYAAASGTKMLLELCSSRLKERFSACWLEKAGEYLVTDCGSILEAAGNDCFLQPIAEGGVMAALWDLKEACKTGFIIDRAGILFRQETIELTDYLGINPYQLSGDGGMLIVCDSPAEICTEMDKAGIPFSVLGRLTSERACIINTKEESTCLDRPDIDGIWQFTNINKEEITT